MRLKLTFGSPTAKLDGGGAIKQTEGRDRVALSKRLQPVADGSTKS